MRLCRAVPRCRDRVGTHICTAGGQGASHVPGGGAQRANTMITAIAGFALRVPSTIMRVSVSRQRRDSYLA